MNYYNCNWPIFSCNNRLIVSALFYIIHIYTTWLPCHEEAKGIGQFQIWYLYYCISLLWLLLHCLKNVISFFPEFSPSERAYCHSKWPQPDSYAWTAATVWTPLLESCTHYNPDCPEGAVGREIRVSALLYRILCGTGERVAVPIPLLPQWRRWAVFNALWSLECFKCLSVMICYAHLGMRHSSPCPWVCTLLLIMLASFARSVQSSPWQPLVLGARTQSIC